MSHHVSQFTDPRPLAERAIHEPGEDKSRRAQRTVTVNLAESPLSWLHARGHLTDRQLLAGEMLRRDYDLAGLEPQVTMQWDQLALGRQKGRVDGGLHQSAYSLTAKERFHDALAMLGPDLSDIAWRVICAGESLPVVERTMAWPARSGKLVLRIALDRLVEYYRVPG